MIMRKGNMSNEKFPQNQDDAFAEKCRRALEKSWGMEIPTPKTQKFKANMQKNPK
jgi:hypothetical protein